MQMRTCERMGAPPTGSGRQGAAGGRGCQRGGGASGASCARRQGAAHPPQEALAAFFGFDQNLPRISFQKRLFGRSVVAFFGFDQMGAARLVKTEHSCQRRAEKRGPRCETARRFGQNRKKLPRASERMAGRHQQGDHRGALPSPTQEAKGRSGAPSGPRPGRAKRTKRCAGGADSGRAHSPGRCARIPTRKRRHRERSQPVRSFDSARPAASLHSG